MKSIIEWFKKFFYQSKINNPESKTETKPTAVDSSLVCGVSFDYFTNQTVGIELLMGSQYDTDHIKFSEVFAKFIYNITQPSFRQTILDSIKENSKEPDEVLFYENIVFNIALLEMYKKETSHTRDGKEPVIRPLSVFNR